MGSYASNGSGDIFIAFSTANTKAAYRLENQTVEFVPNDALGPVFLAAVEATEEAIVNALVAAETMTGINGYTVHELPHDRLQAALKKHGRLVETAESANIPCQIAAHNRGTGTDANAIQLSRAGVVTGLVSIPNRYMHSAVETIALDDIDKSADLLAAFISGLTGNEDFTP